LGSEQDAGSEEVLEVGELRLDLRRYTASWQGQSIGLTVTEFSLLSSLARRPGHVKTRQQLMQDGYPYDAYVAERTIDTHIKRIRGKLSRIDADFDAIETVYGLGYKYREG
jgi:two-component system response regulator ChvI